MKTPLSKRVLLAIWTSPDKRRCRLEGFCDDAKLPVREVPLKSAYRQVHLEVAANPVYGRRWAGSLGQVMLDFRILGHIMLNS
jgi:hypothetical protein